VFKRCHQADELAAFERKCRTGEAHGVDDNQDYVAPARPSKHRTIEPKNSMKNSTKAPVPKRSPTYKKNPAGAG
jgi:hypothetical protein